MKRDTFAEKIADATRRPPRLFLAKLSEEYDGIGRFTKVAMSAGSTSAAYMAEVGAGDFGGGRTFPAGTPVVVHSEHGKLKIITLGNQPKSGCVFIDDFSRIITPVRSDIGGSAWSTFQGLGVSSSKIPWERASSESPGFYGNHVQMVGVDGDLGTFAPLDSSTYSDWNWWLRNALTLVPVSKQQEFTLEFRLRFNCDTNFEVHFGYGGDGTYKYIAQFGSSSGTPGYHFEDLPIGGFSQVTIYMEEWISYYMSGWSASGDPPQNTWLIWKLWFKEPSTDSAKDGFLRAKFWVDGAAEPAWQTYLTLANAPGSAGSYTTPVTDLNVDIALRANSTELDIDYIKICPVEEELPLYYPQAYTSIIQGASGATQDSLWASDDGVTWHEIVTNAMFQAGYIGPYQGSKVDLPSNDRVHRYWEIRYYRFSQGGLRYDGGIDYGAAFLMDRLQPLYNGFYYPAEGVNFFGPSAILTTIAISCPGGAPYGDPRTGGFGVSASMISGDCTWDVRWRLEIKSL